MKYFNTGHYLKQLHGALIRHWFSGWLLLVVQRSVITFTLHSTGF